MLSVFDQLLHAETFTDVTLAVDGQYLKAHKVSILKKGVKNVGLLSLISGISQKRGRLNFPWDFTTQVSVFGLVSVLHAIHPQRSFVSDLCAQLTTSLIKPGGSSK